MSSATGVLSQCARRAERCIVHRCHFPLGAYQIMRIRFWSAVSWLPDVKEVHERVAVEGILEHGEAARGVREEASSTLSSENTG